MLFSTAVEEFLRYCAVERQLSQHTLQAYACDLADFSKVLPFRAQLRDVTTLTLQSYLQTMVSERKLAAGTIRRRFACLRCFFRRLADLRRAKDPFLGWRLRLVRRKRLPRSLSRQEVALLLSALGNQSRVNVRGRELFVAVRLMICTGLRIGELCKLRIEDISPDARSIRIHGKGSRDRVAYVADESFRVELQQLVQNRKRTPAPNAPIFVNRHGLRIKPQSVRKKLHQIARKAGLSRRVTPHMLRHTAATLLIERGVDIRIVQRLLGHSSIATTEIYTHVSDEALRVTLERANVLGNLPS